MMEILCGIILIIISVYLIYDDRKRFDDLRKFKKMVRKSRREDRKESWQMLRYRMANPRSVDLGTGGILKETKLYQSVILEFSFPKFRQKNLDFINETLSRYALKDVTVTDHTGALVTPKNRGDVMQYALKSCKLECDLMPSGTGLDFRISTMAAEKTVKDCALLWQIIYHDRKLCRKVFRELSSAYALVIVHHDKARCLPKREIIPSHGQNTRKLREKEIPMEPFTLEYHFKNRLTTDLERINADLARYELSKLELVDSKGYLATETSTDAENGEKMVSCWYGLDDCVLRCTPAKPGMGQYYRIDTMTMEKTTGDCASLWRINNPDRAMRTVMELSFPEVRAIIVLHHKKTESAAVPVPVSAPPKKTPPVRADSQTKYCCGRPGKDTLVFRYEDGTLYIEGQGRLRCGQWPWLTAPIRHVVIATGCTAIGDFVFMNCRSLETVVLPDTLRTIGEQAFSHCANLREVTIPDSVTGIGKGTFADCIQLRRIHLSEKLTQIHDDTFSNCHNLEDVQIPDGVQYIGNRAFLRVKSVANLPGNLGNRRRNVPVYREQKFGLGTAAFMFAGLPARLEFPDRIDSIPNRAFYGCKTLVSVKLPRCLREIGMEAFSGCHYLECLNIPKTVEEIGKNAFSNVPNICYHGRAQSGDNWGAGHWERTGARQGKCGENMIWRIENGILYIDGQGDMECCEQYPWQDFQNEILRIVFSTGITSVAEAAFADCEKLEEVSFPDGLRKIGADAFMDCKQLLDAEIPFSVTEFGDYAFYGCEALRLHVTNPDAKWEEHSFWWTDEVRIGPDWRF